MKNKLLVLILTGCMITSLVGCNRDAETMKSKNKINIVTTIFPQYDFARQITGDKADITMLLKPGADSHSYEPSPRDIITIENCDMFIYVGGESDDWIDKILNSMDTSNMTIINLMDEVSVLEEEIIEGMEEEHEHEDEHEEENEGEHDEEHEDEDNEEVEYDEHVWTSPKNAILLVKAISEKLCEIDSNNSDFYSQNTKAYIANLEELDAEFEDVVDTASQNIIVFGDRFPFRYFADAYGLEYYAAFPGCSTDTEPSAATIAFLIDKVREDDIPVVFNIEFSNKKIAQTISEATGAKLLQLHTCHSISKGDLEGGVTYLELMKQNVINLKEALKYQN